MIDDIILPCTSLMDSLFILKKRCCIEQLLCIITSFYCIQLRIIILFCAYTRAHNRQKPLVITGVWVHDIINSIQSRKGWHLERPEKLATNPEWEWEFSRRPPRGWQRKNDAHSPSTQKQNFFIFYFFEEQKQNVFLF